MLLHRSSKLLPEEKLLIMVKVQDIKSMAVVGGILRLGCFRLSVVDWENGLGMDMDNRELVQDRMSKMVKVLSSDRTDPRAHQE